MNDTHRGCFEPIAREKWAAHPRFASQALLLGSHRSFRRISRALVEASPVDGEPSQAAELAGTSLETRQGLFDQWQWAMRSHEHYEEKKLYPFLRRRFGVETAQLEAGHHALHAIEVELQAAAAESDEPSWAIAMARYDRVLLEHLRAEEDLVIPCLLALSPGEFRAYYDGSAASVAQTLACAC